MSGRNYDLVLDKPLGQGGEGTVFRTTLGRLAVKLCQVDDDPTVAADLAARLTKLSWLPLDGIPISRPEESLAEPHAGYVMPLLADMVALRTICDPPRGDLGPWYARGGGLRRRLRLLARCAEVLGLLHGRGIVYGDVSPGNVLISAPVDHAEVWFVDADNLQLESAVLGRRLVTPFYTAPEVLRGQTGNTVHSDVYSFAVIAFETLMANHPLLGDLVANGPVEYEDDVQRGLLPWVGHRTDDRNRSTQGGFSSRSILTAKLRELFARNFEDGLADWRRRPAAGEWADALWRAADLTVVCPSCAQTYYGTAEHCPWCKASPPPVVALQVLDQFPAPDMVGKPHIDDPHWFVLVQQRHDVIVRSRLVHRGDVEPDAAVLRVSWNGGGEVVVRNLGGTVRRVPERGGNGRQVHPGGREVEQLAAPWRYHFGPERHHHRVLEIRPTEPVAR
ncbi:protein kinase domain-containing protein [Actinophytocola gossypii]|uniref:Protein kinase domain-containing protein n=1 Tax=Actinophytocola gossypii TaxID=2812003 RepID=A0ABT2JIE0_9PSEU|nr:hypothetical protein [Actinophytocola gossypii]MCT2587551.1 hypothetical protein [Actinophytocola gossypii]